MLALAWIAGCAWVTPDELALREGWAAGCDGPGADGDRFYGLGDWQELGYTSWPKGLTMDPFGRCAFFFNGQDDLSSLYTQIYRLHLGDGRIEPIGTVQPRVQVAVRQGYLGWVQDDTGIGSVWWSRKDGLEPTVLAEDLPLGSVVAFADDAWYAWDGAELRRHPMHASDGRRWGGSISGVTAIHPVGDVLIVEPGPYLVTAHEDLLMTGPACSSPFVAYEGEVFCVTRPAGSFEVPSIVRWDLDLLEGTVVASSNEPAFTERFHLTVDARDFWIAPRLSGDRIDAVYRIPRDGTSDAVRFASSGDDSGPLVANETHVGWWSLSPPEYQLVEKCRKPDLSGGLGIADDPPCTD